MMYQSGKSDWEKGFTVGIQLFTILGQAREIKNKGPEEVHHRIALSLPEFILNGVISHALFHVSILFLKTTLLSYPSQCL